MTLQTFHCPNCNAPQQLDDQSSPTVVCPYCNSTIIMPDALRTQARAYSPGQHLETIPLSGVIFSLVFDQQNHL